MYNRNEDTLKEFSEWLEFLKSEEGKSELDLLTKEFKEKAEEKRKMIFEVTRTEEFINWLEGFTRKHTVFSDSSWMYNENEIEEYDKQMVMKLAYFYDGIDNYARENYLSYQTREFGVYYSIKYNGVGYIIGVDVGQGSEFYCERVEVNEEFIDFNNIMNNIRSLKADEIKIRLEALSGIVRRMIMNGVPSYEIINTVKDVVEKEKNDVNQKRLTYK